MPIEFPRLPLELVRQGYKDWSLPGMPPLPVKELGMQQISKDTRVVFIEGIHPHLGEPHHKGLSNGPETIVFEQTQPDGTKSIKKEMPEHVATVIKEKPEQRRHFGAAA